MFGLIRRSTHVQRLEILNNTWEVAFDKAIEDCNTANAILKQELRNVRAELLEANNKLAQASGKAVADAHAKGKPAP